MDRVQCGCVCSFDAQTYWCGCITGSMSALGDEQPANDAEYKPHTRYFVLPAHRHARIETGGGIPQVSCFQRNRSHGRWQDARTFCGDGRLDRRFFVKARTESRNVQSVRFAREMEQSKRTHFQSPDVTVRSASLTPPSSTSYSAPWREQSRGFKFRSSGRINLGFRMSESNHEVMSAVCASGTLRLHHFRGSYLQASSWKEILEVVVWCSRSVHEERVERQESWPLYAENEAW